MKPIFYIHDVVVGSESHSNAAFTYQKSASNSVCCARASLLGLDDCGLWSIVFPVKTARILQTYQFKCKTKIKVHIDFWVQWKPAFNLHDSKSSF